MATLESVGSYSGLLDAFERYRRAAVGVKDRYEWEMWQHIEPDRLGGDRIGLIDALLRTLAGDLRAAHHLIVFDVDQLLNSIDKGLASRSFRQAVLGVRAVLERAATTEHHLISVRKSLQDVCDFPARQFLKGGLPPKEFKDHVVKRYHAALAVRKYLMAQSFNWASFDAPDGIGNIRAKGIEAQVSAGKAVQLLDWTGPHPEGRNLYWWYNVLCDYVHPNLGASNLFVDVQEEIAIQFRDSRENRLFRRHLSRRPNHVSALTHVLNVIYLPLREVLSWTASHIRWLAEGEDK